MRHAAKCCACRMQRYRTLSQPASDRPGANHRCPLATRGVRRVCSTVWVGKEPRVGGANSGKTANNIRGCLPCRGMPNYPHLGLPSVAARRPQVRRQASVQPRSVGPSIQTGGSIGDQMRSDGNLQKRQPGSPRAQSVLTVTCFRPLRSPRHFRPNQRGPHARAARRPAIRTPGFV
jgi:hypothetical protein